MYSSTGTIIVQYENDVSTIDGINTSTKAISTISSLSKKDAVLSKVLVDLKIEFNKDDEISLYVANLTSSKISSMLNNKVSRDTMFIELTSTTPYTNLSISIVRNTMEELITLSNTNYYRLFNNAVAITDSPTGTSYAGPNKVLYIIASFILGVIISLETIFLIETLKTTLRDKEEVEKFTNVPVLTELPTSKMVNAHSRIAAESFEKDEDGEIYHKLISNIKLLLLEQPHKVIHFTSALTAEGKSTTVINTAISLSKANKKVCIVDLDLSKPVIHKAFNKERQDGVVEYVLDDEHLSKIIKHDEEFNIDIISCGKKVGFTRTILESGEIDCYLVV